ncbi:MAG TPA: YetF domain-containing protein [Vicinamibacterales bacterium]
MPYTLPHGRAPVWRSVMVWSDLVVPGVPILEKIVRPLIVYFALLVLFRMFGKRELAQLNPFDLIVLLTISNTVQNAIIGNDNSVSGGLIGAVTLLVINFLIVRFMYNHEKLERLVEGDATVLIENGRLLKDRLDRELITLAELEAAAHRQGFESLDEVQRAILEPGGTLALFGRKPNVEAIRQEELIDRLDEIRALLKGGAKA